MGLVQSTTNGTKKEEGEGEGEGEGDGKIMQVTRREPEKRGEQSNASGREREEERDRKIRKYLLVVPIFTQKRSSVSAQPFSSFLVDIRDGKCIILELFFFFSPNILLYLTCEEQTN